jgi:TPR repeat protein
MDATSDRLLPLPKVYLNGKDNPETLFRLARYFDGSAKLVIGGTEVDVPRNHAYAARLYLEAAHLGHRGAIYERANYCLRAEGADKDEERAYRKEAFHWLTKAADLERPAGALNVLGEMHERGIGVDFRNEAEALTCYSKAAALGNEDAGANVKRMKDEKAQLVMRMNASIDGARAHGAPRAPRTNWRRKLRDLVRKDANTPSA